MTTAAKLTHDILQSVEIDAPPARAFESLLRRLGPNNGGGPDHPMPMVLEARPGGRWFRDLGNDHGHLWGIVQVIKPPSLLEIHGPLFMSYAVVSHVQFRITERGSGCTLTMRHRILGDMEPDHREGVQGGWQHLLQGVKTDAE